MHICIGKTLALLDPRMSLLINMHDTQNCSFLGSENLQ